MRTVVQQLDRKNLKEEDFFVAGELIRKGKLVAFPTETVYGLGADACNPQASKQIYLAKGRPCDNPLIVHIADIFSLEKLTKEIPEVAYRLAEHFWPGPLTMILKKSDIVPYEITGGLETVGIRMPSDPIASMFIKASKRYIAAPSANSSGRPSTTRAEHVIEDLDGKIDMILDGGASTIGLESTILDLTGEIPTILRPGFITAKQLKQVTKIIQYDKAVLNRNKKLTVVAKAPGMKYKHYAPKADLTIYEGSSKAVIDAINRETKQQELQKRKVGILATDETISEYLYGIVKSVGTRENEITITSSLFERLREFDTIGVEVIYAESFDGMKHGQAVMNRLLKAAGYQIIKV